MFIIQISTFSCSTKLPHDQKSGFVIITNETDAAFLDEAQKALLEKKETALQFNVFRKKKKTQ